MNRRIFLRHTGGATALLLTQPLLRAAAANAGPTDDDVLGEAKERIAKHRQGEGSSLCAARMASPFPA